MDRVTAFEAESYKFQSQFWHCARNTITPWNLVESIVAKIGPTNTATFAPENAMVVMVGTQLVGVLARRQTTIVTARDGAMLMLDSVDIMKAA